MNLVLVIGKGQRFLWIFALQHKKLQSNSRRLELNCSLFELFACLTYLTTNQLTVAAVSSRRFSIASSR